MSAPIGDAVFVPLTAANLKPKHIYLRRAERLIPQDAIGGPNRHRASDTPVTVTFEPGRTISTDVAGDKMILRDRSGVRDFLERSGAKVGDDVCIERTGPRHLRFSLKKRLV